MKKIMITLLLVMFVTPVFAFDVSSITFSITSSAKTSAPNLRIGINKGAMATDGSTPMQSMTVPRSVNYFLTKTTAHTFAAGTSAIEIQVDQDTKMYTGSDLTNYILIYSGVPKIYTVK